MPPWNRVIRVKSYCPCCFLQCTESCIFAPAVYWNFSTGNLNFHKGFLICGWISKIVFSSGSQTMAHRDYGQFTATVGSKLEPRSVCLLFNSLVSETPPRSLGVWCSIPQLPHKGIFVHGCQIVVGGKDTNEGHLIRPWCWCHSLNILNRHHTSVAKVIFTPYYVNKVYPCCWCILVPSFFFFLVFLKLSRILRVFIYESYIYRYHIRN